MSIQNVCRLLVAIMLPLSIAFAVYLYPGPEATSQAMMFPDHAKDQSSAGGAGTKMQAQQELSDETRTNIRELAWRSWMVNLLLFVTGTASSVIWLLWGRKQRAARWLALLSMIAFAALFIAVVIPSNSESLLQWIPDKLSGLSTLMAIKAWGFMAAELHRVVAFGLGVITAVCMCIASLKTTSTPATT